MAIDSRAEPEPTGRGYMNGTGSHGGGHGGAPPPSLERRVDKLEDRQEEYEKRFDLMIGDVRAVTAHAIDLQAMTIRLDSDGKRRDIEARDVKLAIQNIATKLEHTAEDTGQFRINVAMQSAAAATAKATEERDEARAALTAERAKQDERARHYTRAIIAAVVAIMVAIIVYKFTH